MSTQLWKLKRRQKALTRLRRIQRHLHKTNREASINHVQKPSSFGRVVDHYDDPASGTGDWSLQRAMALRESLRDALAATYDLVAVLKRQRFQRRKAADAQSQLQLSKSLAGER